MGERAAKCPVPTFVVMFISAAVVLLAVGNANSYLYVEVRMLRGPFLVILLSFLFLVNVRAWQAFGIDYVKILRLGEEQDDYHAPRIVGILTSCLGFLWAVFVTSVAYCVALDVYSPRRTLPLVLWILIVGLVMNPFRVFFYRFETSLTVKNCYL